MASLQCNTGDGQPAVFTGTVLATGDNVTVCGEHFIAWCKGMVAQDLGVDPATFVEILEGIQAAAVDAAENVPVEIVDDVLTVAEGAASDEPPGEQPADPDPEAETAPEPESNGSAKSKGKSATGK